MNAEYTFKNYMVDMVDAVIPHFLEENKALYGKISKSEYLLLQLKVFALNRLPTMYVTTKVGEVYSEYSMKSIQNKADVIKALSEAAELVIKE